MAKDKSIRVRQEDLEKSIHPITSNLKDKHTMVQSKPNYDGFDETDDIIVYAFKGTEDDISPGGYPIIYDISKNSKEMLKNDLAENRDIACAKQEKIRDKYIFTIKTCRGVLYDPHELVGNPRNMVSGISQYKWITVSTEIFKLYIEFLRTRNQTYLLQARRL